MGNSVFFFSSFFLSQTKVMVIMRMMMTIAICRARICPRNKSILTALKKNAHQKKKKNKKGEMSAVQFWLNLWERMPIRDTPKKGQTCPWLGCDNGKCASSKYADCNSFRRSAWLILTAWHTNAGVRLFECLNSYFYSKYCFKMNMRELKYV